MNRHLFLLTLVAVFAFPVIECQAQKLKLPNLMPFKRKSKEVEPFKLSDRSNSRPASTAKNNQLFDFLKPREKSNAQANGFGDNGSKSFFDRTGDEFGKFSQGTKKFMNNAWNPPRARKAWWNQGQEQQAETPSAPLFVWPGTRPTPQSVQPPMPAPRTANQYRYGQPKHRFK